MSSPVTTRWSCAATPRRSPSWKASPSASTSSRGSNYSIPELLDTGLPGDADERIAAFEHVVERAERVHVVAAKARAFDPSEHVGEIDVALAGRQVHLVPVAEAVGEAHLLDPAHIERVDKSGDALRHQMRMVGGERQPKRRRVDRLEIEPPFLDRMGEIMHLGLFRLLAQVFEEDQRALSLGVIDDPPQSLAPGLHPLFPIGGEVKP